MIDDKVGTTKPSVKDSENLLVLNNELDDESIAEIKNSICNHYLLIDLSVQIM
jgi:predicted transcriptional regulator